VVDLIDKLYQSYIKIAIVSASNRERLMNTVSEEIRSKFDCIISGDDTREGKPHPDPYLTASRKLGVDIRNCVVIENAPLGITSAKRAGAYCIGISSTMDKKYLQEADEVIGKFTDLFELSLIKYILEKTI